MKTKVIKVNPSKPKGDRIRKAAEIIQKGGTVAFPTETVYGLGANALDAKAVRKIFKAKKRPYNDPLIVHIAHKNWVYLLTEKVPKATETLMKKFWPGPLTLVLKKSEIVPRITTGGLSTVAVRMPKHKVAQALIMEVGAPIAAPSANLFGRPSPTNAKHVLEDLDGKIDCVIDAGRTRIGVESTVLDMNGKTPVILRPGKISREEIEKVLRKRVAAYSASSTKKTRQIAAKSPGLLYRHYAPKAKLILVEGKPKNIRKKISELEDALRGKKVVVLRKTGKEKMAATLFNSFREADRKGTEVIVAEGVDEKGIGMAVMNRMKKAAGRIIRV